MKTDIKVGSKLPNGASVLAVRNGKLGYPIVLAEWQNGSHRPFVTWTCDTQGNAYWGNYFSNLEEATTDYFNR